MGGGRTKSLDSCRRTGFLWTSRHRLRGPQLSWSSLASPLRSRFWSAPIPAFSGLAALQSSGMSTSSSSAYVLVTCHAGVWSISIAQIADGSLGGRWSGGLVRRQILQGMFDSIAEHYYDRISARLTGVPSPRLALPPALATCCAPSTRLYLASIPSRASRAHRPWRTKASLTRLADSNLRCISAGCARCTTEGRHAHARTSINPYDLFPALGSRSSRRFIVGGWPYRGQLDH
ncbi:hypothetical protein DAEQUDRAFT_457104 [Daedalea quercina L-15889]|uniref:Uncharacterized protein n=1 Tax=Daedalea quercina L-15889 TaxID=1314783 RepID=A0A165N0S8_9APHY|nr:hypothetical protein DAEQUDRAFT_457104 [Daedalea quercina L-15889]